MKTTAKLWIGIAILILLSPLGLIFPALFKAKDAWGEWGVDTFKELIGYIPQGFKKLSNIWSAPVPDYTFKGNDKSLAVLSFDYILSALIGILICVGVVFLIGKILAKKK